MVKVRVRPETGNLYLDFGFRGVRCREQTALEQASPGTAAKAATPLFSDFAQVWYHESEPRWRLRHRKAIRATLDVLILPTFGTEHLETITRAALLDFRARLAQRRGHGGQSLSAKRNNKIMGLLRTILNEGCDRYGLISPGRSIKPLKQKRSEVMPFTLEEMGLLIGRSHWPGLPHTRGGVSATMNLQLTINPSSPHACGCFSSLT